MTLPPMARSHHGPQRCLGLRVVLALADAPAGAGGLTLLPASHKSTVPAPPAVLADPEASLAAVSSATPRHPAPAR